MIDIEIWNFQNIKHTKLEVNGFSVLVGESNIGKTSVCRALQCVAENIPSAAFIRHGEDKAKVQITHYAGGWRVTWERTKAGAKYKLVHFDMVDGKINLDKIVKSERFDKPGRSVPDPIKDLKFLKLDTEDFSASVGYASQHRYMFLLDDPKQLVQLAGELKAVAKLNNAMGTARSETRTLRDEGRLLEKQVTQLKVRQSQLDGVEELKELLTDVERVSQQRDRLVDRDEGLSKVGDRLKRLKIDIVENKTRLSQLEGLEEVEGDIVVVTELQDAISPLESEIKQLSRGLQRTSEIGGTLPRLQVEIAAGEQAKEVDIEPLQEMQDGTQRLQQLGNQLTRLKGVVRGVQGVSSMVVVGEGEIGELVSGLQSLGNLRELQGQLDRVRGQVVALVEDGKANDARLTVITGEIKKFAEEHPVCDSCGSDVKVEKLLNER